jgi:hypothetical protein
MVFESGKCRAPAQIAVSNHSANPPLECGRTLKPSEMAVCKDHSASLPDGQHAVLAAASPFFRGTTGKKAARLRV